jgi:hypothetical protein
MILTTTSSGAVCRHMTDLYGADLQSPQNSLCLAPFTSPTYQITREALSTNACKV